VYKEKEERTEKGRGAKGNARLYFGARRNKIRWIWHNKEEGTSPWHNFSKGQCSTVGVSETGERNCGKAKEENKGLIANLKK